MSVNEQAAPTPLGSDEQTLHQLGYARDGALPASGFWHRVNRRTRTPTNAIWLAAAGAFILGLPYLRNPTAYAAVTSIAVIGLYIAYLLPTFRRLGQGANFQRGPWHLGRWSRLIGPRVQGTPEELAAIERELEI